MYVVDGQRILILTTMFLAEDREKYGPLFQNMLDNLHGPDALHLYISDSRIAAVYIASGNADYRH